MIKVMCIIFFFVSEYFVSFVYALDDHSDLVKNQQTLKTTFYIYPGQISVKDKERISEVNPIVPILAGAAIGGGLLFAAPMVVVTGTVTTIVAASFAGVFGGIAGGVAGLQYGKKRGAEYAQEIIEENMAWRDVPCLDLAFRTTQEDCVKWEATVQLRPIEPGWRDKAVDQHTLYLSFVQVILYFNDKGYINDKEILKVKGSDLSLLRSDDTISYQNSIFKGTLNKPIFIEQLIDAIYKMKNPVFPKCNWSGQNLEGDQKQTDVMNPAMFTCRLLENLGVPLHDTSLGRFIVPYTGGEPATRMLIIDNLRKSSQNLGLTDLSLNKK